MGVLDSHNVTRELAPGRLLDVLNGDGVVDVLAEARWTLIDRNNNNQPPDGAWMSVSTGGRFRGMSPLWGFSRPGNQESRAAKEWIVTDQSR